MSTPFIEKSDEELKELSDDELFTYLDAKALHLRQTNTIKPLGSYHTKQFASIAKGDILTTEELKAAKAIGSIGDNEWSDGIRKAVEKLGGDPKLSDPGIKNIKTNRKQWFD
jgi:hypothetical protein